MNFGPTEFEMDAASAGSLRFAMPTARGRGAGLGNELHFWAKAFIGGQVLGLKVLHPAWGLNWRSYWRYFGTSRLDRIGYELLKGLLPVFEFTEEEFNRRQPMNFADAVADYGREQGLSGKKAFIVEFSGMWGGLPAVMDAQEFILGALLDTRYTRENLYAFRRAVGNGSYIVGIHVRRGDFKSGISDYSGRFNVAIPIDWFVQVARNLRESHSSKVVYCIFGDASEEELAPLRDVLGSQGIRISRPNSDISDLIALSRCDLIICSVSSFSMWACALSGGRYIWFAPNLTISAGRGTIWGGLSAQTDINGQTRRHANSARALEEEGFVSKGVAVDWNGKVPDELHTYIENAIRVRRAELDLLQYGSVAI